jgi:catechol 2,3-dioxygenase-like lactoylglutathione lyase family enzyme
MIDPGMAARFGLTVQPMVHVENMPASVDFYETLGGRVMFGSRDGDWVLLRFGDTTVSLLARPPGDGRLETVELQFACSGDLVAVEAHLRTINPALIERGVADEMFGRMLKLATPDGLTVKILQVERDALT